MRPDDITPEELDAYKAAHARTAWVTDHLAAMNALRDERVRRAERARIAQEIEAMETPRSTTVHYTEIAERVREGGDTKA